VRTARPEGASQDGGPVQEEATAETRVHFPRPKRNSETVATLEGNDVNPVTYLADVLIRVQTHPASRIDEMPPHKWKPPKAWPSA